MTHHPDVDAYLHRIDVPRPPAPTREALAAIVAAHAATIPFENLTPFAGDVPSLERTDLERKLVRDGRGGYCFEHNGLLLAMLEALGYDVTPLAARVLWGRPVDAVTARGHMLLRVDLDDGPHIVDVGFGGQVLTGVLRLEAGTEQKTPHEPFRLTAEPDGHYRLETLVAGQWRPLYRFDLVRQHAVDYEVSNWYLATLPTSHFRTGLIAARSPDGRRQALRGRRVSVHHLDGPTEQRELTGPDDLVRTLRDEFGVRLPEPWDAEAAFARLT